MGWSYEHLKDAQQSFRKGGNDDDCSPQRNGKHFQFRSSEEQTTARLHMRAAQLLENDVGLTNKSSFVGILLGQKDRNPEPTLTVEYHVPVISTDQTTSPLSD
jgi:hypothetical protein